MNAPRRRRPPKRKRISIIVALLQGIRHHLITRVGWYVPAVVPVLLFVLAHLLTLIVFILIHCGLFAQNPALYKTVVTWAVYGFFPLLLCSYGCFFGLARPGIFFLAKRFPHWSLSNLHLANGGVYGAGTGVALLALLQPGVGPKSLLLFLIGLTSGVGNWLLYRKLTAVDPLAGMHQAETAADKIEAE